MGATPADMGDAMSGQADTNDVWDKLDEILTLLKSWDSMISETEPLADGLEAAGLTDPDKEPDPPAPADFRQMLIHAHATYESDSVDGFQAALLAMRDLFEEFHQLEFRGMLIIYANRANVIDDLDWAGFFEHMATMADQYEEDSGKPMTAGEFRFAVGYSIREKLMCSEINGYQPGGPETKGVYGRFLKVASEFALTWARLDGCTNPPKIQFSTDTTGGPPASTPLD